MVEKPGGGWEGGESKPDSHHQGTGAPPTLLHGTGRKHILQDGATAQHTDCPNPPLSETGKSRLALVSYSLPPDLTLLPS